VDGFATQRYELEAASGLSGTWMSAPTLTNVTGSVAWLDIGAHTNRFYRAQILNP
jgi:hypothetical protein